MSSTAAPRWFSWMYVSGHISVRVIVVLGYPRYDSFMWTGELKVRMWPQMRDDVPNLGRCGVGACNEVWLVPAFNHPCLLLS
eukprot:352630-Chlamydomonas_euryale.AAC.5